MLVVFVAFNQMGKRFMIQTMPTISYYFLNTGLNQCTAACLAPPTNSVFYVDG